MEEMSAAIDAVSSPAVKIWLSWMSLIFIASVLFVYRHVEARFILGVMLLTLPVAFLIFDQTQSPHLIGVAHLILWLPLAIYLIRRVFLGKIVRPLTPFGIYLMLLLTTIGISLFFDIRDLVLILLGMKDPQS